MLLTNKIARTAVALAIVVFIAALGATAASARMTKLAQYGSWTSYGDGTSVLVIDRFQDQTNVMLSVKDGKLALLLNDKRWDLKPEEAYTVTISVDGRIFTVEARFSDRNTLVAGNLAPEFLPTFCQGRLAEITIGDQRWQMTLTGAARTFNAALSYLTRTAYWRR